MAAITKAIAVCMMLIMFAQAAHIKYQGRTIVLEGDLAKYLVLGELTPVGHSTVDVSIFDKNTQATNYSGGATYEGEYCTTGTHKDDGKCVANTAYCDEYNETSHSCVDCTWYTWEQIDHVNGNYCKTRWWAFILATVLGIVLGGMVLGALAVCCAKPKAKVDEELPLVKYEPKKEMEIPRQVVVESAPPPPIYKQEIVYVDAPRVVERVVERPQVYERHGEERVVYGEPRYVNVSTNVRESRVQGNSMERVHVDTRTYSPERYTSSRVHDADPRTYGSRVVQHDQGYSNTYLANSGYRESHVDRVIRDNNPYNN